MNAADDAVRALRAAAYRVLAERPDVDEWRIGHGLELKESDAEQFRIA